MKYALYAFVHVRVLGYMAYVCHDFSHLCVCMYCVYVFVCMCVCVCVCVRVCSAYVAYTPLHLHFQILHNSTPTHYELNESSQSHELNEFLNVTN